MGETSKGVRIGPDGEIYVDVAYENQGGYSEKPSPRPIPQPDPTPHPNPMWAVLAMAVVGVMLILVLKGGTGAKTVSVPYVEGLEQGDARDAIAAVGLSATESSEHSDAVSSGHVIRQNPSGGTEVAEGSSVSISVSKGSKPIEQSQTTDVSVPSLTGLTLEEAQTRLRERGLDATWNSEYSNTVDSGHVIRQSPDAGTSVSEGTTVTVTMSKGPEPTTSESKDEESQSGGALSGTQNNDQTQHESNRKVLHPQAEGVNLRAEPQHESEWVGEAYANDLLYFYGEIGYGLGSDGLQHEWYYVNVAGTGVWGYVRSDLVFE